MENHTVTIVLSSKFAFGIILRWLNYRYPMEIIMDKKLYKSLTDRKISGVCGGIAQYFNIDSTIIRLIWALAVFCFGCGVIAYIVCAIVIPDEPTDNQYQTHYNNANEFNEYYEENKE